MFRSVKDTARAHGAAASPGFAWDEDDEEARARDGAGAARPGGAGRRSPPPAPDAGWDGDTAEGADDDSTAAPLPVHDPEQLGAALWHALYGAAAPGEAPPFCVVLVERTRSGATLTLHSRPPHVAAAPPPAWNDPEVRRQIVEPLLRRAIAVADGAGPPSLILLPSGAVFAASHAAAYAALMRGCPPPDPRAPLVRVHPAVVEVWETARAMARSSHPLIAWIGAVGALLIALILGVGVWVWATEIVTRLSDALGAAPVTHDWSAPLRLSVAVAVSALEVWGLLFLSSRVARSVAGVTAALDIAFHAWYGWRAAGDDLAAQVIGAAVGVGTALLPELALVIGVVALLPLLPLWAWALIQVRMAWLQLLRVMYTEADRYARARAEVDAQHRGPIRAYTIIDGDGQTRTVYTYASETAAADEGDAADAADAPPPRPRRR